jgi:hypothetical protein
VSELSLADAEALYGCARSMTVAYHVVEHPLLQKLCKVGFLFENATRATATEDFLRPLVRDARTIRFELATSPLAFSDTAIAQRLSTAKYDGLLRKASVAYPEHIECAAELVSLLKEALASEANPLLDALEAFGGHDTALIILKARLVEAVRAALRTRSRTRLVEVLTPEALRGPRVFQRLIVCGPTRWFPDFVFSAPRAGELHVVSYRWQHAQWSPHSPFLAQATSSPAATASGGSYAARDEDLTNEEWHDLDWEAIARRALEGPDGEPARQGPELLETRLFSLSGGFAVFLDVTNHSKSLVIDPTAHGVLQVRRVFSDDIEPETYLLRRTEGGGDYIVPLADQILAEKAGPHRAMQRHWKERLRQVVAASTETEASGRLMDVGLRLIDLGSQRADEANLRHWMSARCIGTRDKRDFQAIMGLVGLGSEADRYWSVMRQILAAHHQAGSRIRRRLIEQVRAVDFGSTERQGRIDFVLPDAEGGKLSAFLVEARAPTRTLVPAQKEGQLFVRED